MIEGVSNPGGPPPVPVPAGKSFYHQAATSSVWLILFPFVIQLLSAMALNGMPADDARLAHLFFAAIIGLAMLAGIVLGIIALFGISKYGTKGILVKALFGTLVPVLLIVLATSAILRARDRARQLNEELSKQLSIQQAGVR